MAKLKTAEFSFDGSIKNELKFKTDIYVDKEGDFSTTLPKDIVELFKSANIDLSRNRMGNAGYLFDKSYDSLMKQINDICAEFLSREMTSETIVLRYIIQTACSYCLDESGKIVPNGGFLQDFMKNGKWKGGTLDTNATNRHAFGLQVYVKPSVRRDYSYKSGKTKTEYTPICYGIKNYEKFLNERPNLKWVDGIVGIAVPEAKHESDIKEIEYTEATAGFFKNMIVSICMMNEKIKDFLEPDAIRMIAEKGMNLLGSGEAKSETSTNS